MSPLIKPSTRAFARAARQVKGFTPGKWLEGWFYMNNHHSF